MHWTNPKRLLASLAVASLLGTAAFALPVEAASLRMAWSQDATGLDPHKQTAFSSLRLLELIYEPLVRLDPKLDVVPAIATSWEFAADGKTLTFKLDPKAKFTNGAAVTSARCRTRWYDGLVTGPTQPSGADTRGRTAGTAGAGATCRRIGEGPAQV